MSLTHILKTARKLGIPVVITNERGESAQVVMPFEDFASMVSGSRSGECSCCDDLEDDEEEMDMPTIEEMNRWSEEAEDGSGYDFAPEEMDELEKKTNIDEKITVEPFTSEKEEKREKSQVEDSEISSVSLEDQFYFESIPQDQEKE